MRLEPGMTSAKQITALLLSMVGACAQAQSSVNLFGVIDLNARHVRNGSDSISSLSPNGMTPSRVGFRGVEDLGDGLKAILWLEGGVFADVGSQSDPQRFWNRRATVGLAGTYGELRLGRDFDPTYQGYALYDQFGAIGIATVDKFVNTFGTTVDTLIRSDNQVSYFTPEGLGGFYGRVSIVPGEGISGKKYLGGRLGYGTKKYDASLSYSQTTVTPIASGDSHYLVGNVAGRYDLGFVRFTGHVTQSRYADARLTVVNVGFSAPLGHHLIRGSYVNVNSAGTHPSGANINRNDAAQLALGYIYEFTKRTSLYGTVAHIRNKGLAAFTIASAPALPGPDTGQRGSTGYETGIRHIF